MALITSEVAAKLFVADGPYHCRVNDVQRQFRQLTDNDRNGKTKSYFYSFSSAWKWKITRFTFPLW